MKSKRFALFIKYFWYKINSVRRKLYMYFNDDLTYNDSNNNEDYDLVCLCERSNPNLGQFAPFAVLLKVKNYQQSDEE